MLSNANENWYIILYDLFSRLWYIATCGPFCKDATHLIKGGSFQIMSKLRCIDQFLFGGWNNPTQRADPIFTEFINC